MAMINNAEIWYIKCDPKKPNATFSKKNPTWEVQLRTKDRPTKKKWEDLKLNVKLIEEEDDAGNVINSYWRANLKKPSIDSKGEPAKPVKVMNGGLEDIDPATIANGSLANVRVFQYDYNLPAKDGEPAKSGVASMLMAIQVTRHIIYVPQKREDDFDMQDTETIAAEQAPSDEIGEDDTAPRKPASAPAPSTNAQVPAGRNADDF
jgi:hypothetical protein